MASLVNFNAFQLHVFIIRCFGQREKNIVTMNKVEVQLYENATLTGHYN